MSTQRGTPGHDLSSLKIDDDARSSGKGGKWLGPFAAGLFFVLVIAGLIVRFRDPKPEVEVTTARGAVNVQAALLNASGYVTPRRRSSVAAKITSRVVFLNSEEGIHVRQGDVLALLDCTNPDSALVSAKADRDAMQSTMDDLVVNLGNAERELKRTQDLEAAGVQTPQALDAAQTLVTSYRARIASTKVQVTAADAKIGVAQMAVNDCTVRAPYDGQVVSKDAQLGEMVSPISAGGGFTRTGVATIVDMNSLEVEVDVNESYIARVKPSQKVISTLDAYPDWQIPSKVRTIIPTADRQKATVKVRISFDKLDPRILPDMGVKVAFLGDEPPAVVGKAAVAKALIPRAAVRQQDGKPTVFLVRDGKLEHRAVSLGADRGEDVEVLAGVSEGDRIVVKGPENLQEGQAVQIKQ
jgi:HlyD family secretion protein